MISKITNSQPPQVGPSETLRPSKMSLPAPAPYLLHRCVTAKLFFLYGVSHTVHFEYSSM